MRTREPMGRDVFPGPAKAVARSRSNTADYNRKRVHARLQDAHEAAATGRSGVRLLRRCGQLGAYHAPGTALPDPHSATDPDARGHLDRLQATSVRGAVRSSSRPSRVTRCLTEGEPTVVPTAKSCAGASGN